MEALNLYNEDDNDSDDDSIVITHHHLQLNVRKAMRNTKIYTDSLLINTVSTCSVFNCEKMLINVKKRNKTLRAFTSGRHQDSNLVGNLPGFFQVWFNPYSMINILAWSNVREISCITVNTAKEDAINAHIGKERVIKFVEVESGLYLLQNQSNDNKK